MPVPVPAPLAERFPWLAGVPVCDGLWPWSSGFLPAGADLATQIGRYRAAGFTHASFTLSSGRETEADALANLGRLSGELARAGVVVAHERAAILAAQAEDAFSASFHFQSATPFARCPELVEAFLAAGVQRSILAYNEANIFADGCHEPRNAGLSAAGRDLVRRMGRIGMRVDLSHCGVRTTFDVLEAGLPTPPLFSHSNARALFDHERNITDEQIRAAAGAGSYIGINGVGFFLGVQGEAIPREMARHAAHVAEISGSAERIGLGLDFMYLEGSDYGFYHAARERWPRGYPEPPWSFFQPEQLGDLVAALVAAGFTQKDVRGLLGENYLRHVVAG